MGKNIAFLIRRLTGGGAERVISNLSLYLSNRINPYVILYSSSEEKVTYDYKGKLTDLLPDPSISFLIRWKSRLLYRIYKLNKIKNKEKIDTVISFIDQPNLLNIYSNIISSHKCRVIISVRNFPSCRENNLRKKLIKIFYPKADLIVALSKGVKFDLMDNFEIDEKKIKVIYNFCDINKIQNQSKKVINDNTFNTFLEKGCKIIVNVASFKGSGQKGQWHLIRAFKRVLEVIPNARLVLIGEGEKGNYLKDLSYNLGISNKILFLGWQDNPFKFMYNSDIFVFPSIFEGFGNAIIEAMACGLPVISSDCPAGPREILAPDTDFRNKIKDEIELAKYGILTPVCDGKFYNEKDPFTKEEILLSESIINVLKNKKIRKKYRNQSKKRIEDFSPENIIEQWLDVINE